MGRKRAFQLIRELLDREEPKALIFGEILIFITAINKTLLELKNSLFKLVSFSLRVPGELSTSASPKLILLPTKQLKCLRFNTDVISFLSKPYVLLTGVGSHRRIVQEALCRKTSVLFLTFAVLSVVLSPAHAIFSLHSS